ncbi:MAG: tripartite tricarboxylate transporter TctB family protein [Gemmatimonadetes bacterium]|nr:tripartite tricarboxylate transporter TctB family protein [Gemmatimonadota bacterium]NNM05764.1 tripartite tricarboxylate transporter TctB family protein [Gemmatimonadota bacterium]
MRTLDRWLGASLLVLAFGLAAAARTFDVGFLVDPLGPKALPYLVIGLFLVGGMALLLAPHGPGPSGEGAAQSLEEEGAARGDGRASKTWPDQALCLLILLGYAAALPLFGFVPSTAMATGALSKVFSGRFLWGLGVGLALGLGLFGLFTLGFGMELPLGIFLEGDL